MSDIRDFCPLWGEWEVEAKIGEGSFGTVWRMKRNILGEKVYYSAVKHISIPKDLSEIDKLISEGIVSDERSAKNYYSYMLRSIADEIDAMHKLQGYTNIVSYEDHKIIPKETGIGYDLFLRMELLKPLTTRIRQGMNIQDVAFLGRDIATAISVLSDHQMIHRDIKPQNIFVNDREIYKLGDYGTARALGTGATAMSRKGTYNYMSPEIYNNQKADIRADIYSLGLVLYRLLNGNRLPFLPMDETVTSEDSDSAVMRRISGEQIPPPQYADERLAAIVLRACAFRPDDRYGSANEMIRDLEKYCGNRNDQMPVEDLEKTLYDPHEYKFDVSERSRVTGEPSLPAAPVHSPETDPNDREKTIADAESLPVSGAPADSKASPQTEKPAESRKEEASPAQKEKQQAAPVQQKPQPAAPRQPVPQPAVPQQPAPPPVQPPVPQPAVPQAAAPHPRRRQTQASAPAPQRSTQPAQGGLPKWLIPVAAVLCVCLIAGILWATGVFSPQTDEPSESSSRSTGKAVVTPAPESSPSAVPDPELIQPGTLFWQCSACDSLNDVSTDLFCTECGKTWLCLECGAEMPKEDLYCTNCGIERGCWKCSHCQTTCSGPADSCKTCKTPRHEPGSP